MSQNQQISQQEIQQRIQQLDSAVKTLMTKEALQRYTNVKIAHPEKALKLMMLISQRIQEGKISEISDEELKYYLTLMEPQKRQVKINRV